MSAEDDDTAAASDGHPRADDSPDGARPDGGTTAHAAMTADETRSDGTARQVLGVARREYRVLSRARWTYGLAALFGAFSLAVVGLAGTATGPTGAGALLVTLAELSVYLVPLAALALGYGTVVGADERGTLELLLSVPLGRTELLVGKYLGRAATLAVGMALGLGAGAVVVLTRFGPAVLPAYLHYLLTAVVVGAAFLSLGVCLSAATAEKARALGGALLAWVLFVLVYDLAALGVVVALDPPGWLLSALVVGNPADALRLVVLSLVPTSGGGVGAALATTAVSTPALAVGLALWIAVPLAVGGRLLARRA
ncbi:ABC transporter permease [Halosimplex halophilum]|uniref:ABC transporter permease n=1 Tax=Halosimplex halophilum TaxID=2559572 RepID=UPI00107F2249|nr:ABC transporter permease [Halosimplex halophilum]